MSSLVCCLFLISSFAFATNVYRYKDENGNWQFSDVPAGAEGEDLVRMQDSSEKKLYEHVWVRELEDYNPAIIVVNNYYGPVQATVRVECAACEIRSQEKTVVVPAFSEARAVALKPIRNRWEATYDLSIVLGDPSAQPDTDHLYLLPFEELVPYLITQGFNGPYTHTDEQNIHAIDIAMPIAAPIHAARGGVVMAIEEENQEAGFSPEYADKANTIYILHSDGTIGVYAHLDMFSALVEPGEKVSAGDYIGRAGNTGFSSGPHLHFTLLRNDNGVQRSFSYRFDDGTGEGFVPHAGELITRGFSRVEREVAADSRGMYEESLAQLKLLEGIERGDPEEDSVSKSGQSLWDKAKSIFD